jgi:hypothetical protein
MRWAYICNGCLARHERAAGQSWSTMSANPSAQCGCGRIAENVVDLDEQRQAELPLSCDECKSAPKGCETPALCRVVQASRRIS